MRLSFILAAIPRQLYKPPTLKVLLATVFLWLLAYEYCRHRYWRDPHSAFFNDRHVYDWKYSLHREHEARRLITAHNAPSALAEPVKAGANPLICAVIVTVNRGTDDYFDASIGSLLAGLDERERRALQLNIVFADTDPSRHPSWGQKWVNRLADQAGSYDVSRTRLQHLQDLEQARNFYEKGVFDYIHALNSCQATNAPYTAVFEDDVIFADGWMAKTVKALADIYHRPKQTPWIYLRLFYTETSLSWSSSDFAYRNMHLIFLLGMLFSFTILLSIRRLRLHGHSHLHNTTIIILTLLSTPCFIALTYMIGKYSLMPLHGVVEMNAHGCCTQGLVFPREQISGLIGYLVERNDGQTDALIEEYADKEDLMRYALAPQQLQHVGLKSSRGNPEVNTQSTWAFWYEENDPGVLGGEHQGLLGDRDVRGFLDGR
ncbi:integral membrane protein [Aspergillus heteromorphus CBS 117.55]|uniref:Integral membrane protein n=1 Tax=Aspergillus heteromorphus CBS 117.55 TaxID=1448321 RepID=A0A317V961_9EURO|nr:uncharacterized protein BO70DRAFT_343087 [Aspergillus heteromorphus CBS 117.55]PWY70914.1 integral membrane protein [Aspergillus heteromorphus CBS 117.55]